VYPGRGDEIVRGLALESGKNIENDQDGGGEDLELGHHLPALRDPIQEVLTIRKTIFRIVKI